MVISKILLLSWFTTVNAFYLLPCNYKLVLVLEASISFMLLYCTACTQRMLTITYISIWLIRFIIIVTILPHLTLYPEKVSFSFFFHLISKSYATIRVFSVAGYCHSFKDDRSHIAVFKLINWFQLSAIEHYVRSDYIYSLLTNILVSFLQENCSLPSLGLTWWYRIQCCRYVSWWYTLFQNV